MSKKHKYRIIKEEGNPHGDLYELEISTYFYVIDNKTNKTVMTLTGEYFTTLGDDGDWKEGVYSGPREVKLCDDDIHVLVHESNGKVKKLKIPQGQKE